MNAGAAPPDRGCHHLRVRPEQPEYEADYEAWRESRWPPLIALAVGAALYATLPGSLILGGGWLRWIIPALLVVLMVVSAVQPVAETDRRRHVGIALVVLITIANASAIALLLHGIVTESGFEGKYLILSSVQVWFTNVIVFSLWFWEIDGGGPRHRALDRARPHDFLFAQYQVPEPWTWRPKYLDYLYVSTTNSTSFAPADALPMRHRMKVLMAVQSLLSVVVIIVVISRAVSILD